MAKVVKHNWWKAFVKHRFVFFKFKLRKNRRFLFTSLFLEILLHTVWWALFTYKLIVGHELDDRSNRLKVNLNRLKTCDYSISNIYPVSTLTHALWNQCEQLEHCSSSSLRLRNLRLHCEHNINERFVSFRKYNHLTAYQ